MKSKTEEHLELILYDFECAYHYLEYSIKHIEYLQKSPELNEKNKKELFGVYVNISNIMKNLNKLRNVEKVTNLLENYEEQ